MQVSDLDYTYRLAGPKICIVGLSFAELEMGKTVHLESYLLLSGRSKHQFQ